MSTCEECVINNTMNISLDRPMIGISIIIDDYSNKHDKIRFYRMNESSNKDHYDYVLLPGHTFSYNTYVKLIYNRERGYNETVIKIIGFDSASKGKYSISYDDAYSSVWER